MALVKCGGCGRSISSQARSCPKCGHAASDKNRAPEAAPAPKEVKVAQDSPRPSATQTASSRPRPDIGREPEQQKGSEAARASHGPAASLKKAPSPIAAAPLGDDASKDQTPWFYVGAAGRRGPVSLTTIRSLAAQGELSPETLIWKSGMADWTPLSQYHEDHALPAPEASSGLEPLLPKQRGGAALAWGVALAPLWGALIQIICTEFWIATTHAKLGSYGQLWWILIALNLGACYLEFRSFRKSGADQGTFEKWLFLAVPMYIYRRDKVVQAKQTRVIVWSVSLSLSVAVFIFLNSIYTKIR